ncbi:MAG: SAM-dependent methyltransferase, partial [Gammaproteobacteria bacterium]|nr:SAM-dependent methyltransferase [Gammaproteobacteria bacterium]
MAASDWPEPDADARSHSETLVGVIRERIAAQGALPFDEFMDLALYAPGLGYYAAGATKFGAAGDFVTAPELTPVFASCIARQCAAWLTDCPDWGVIEFGAGTGRMAADILTSLDALGVAPAFYAIVEPSPDLRDRQRRTVAAQAPDILERVIWWEALPDRPVSAVVLANEVLDALPVKCLANRSAGLVERRV